MGPMAQDFAVTFDWATTTPRSTSSHYTAPHPDSRFRVPLRSCTDSAHRLLRIPSGGPDGGTVQPKGLSSGPPRHGGGGSSALGTSCSISSYSSSQASCGSMCCSSDSACGQHARYRPLRVRLLEVWALAVAASLGDDSLRFTGRRSLRHSNAIPHEWQRLAARRRLFRLRRLLRAGNAGIRRRSQR